MADLALKWDGVIGDLEFGEMDIVTDDSLKSAILISIFTDKRHEGERGCWIDSFEDDPVGSRLWLLDREKKISEIPLRANEYVRESLQWLIRDGIVKSVKVDSYIEGQNILQIPIEVTKPDGKKVNYQFDSVWRALEK